MRLRLDMCDVDLQLKIKDWQKPVTHEDAFDQWTHTEFSLKGKYIDYSFDSEILLSHEVTYLRDALDALLRGDVKERCEVSFVEPDFIFKLTPAMRLYDEPGRVIYRNGYIDVDIDLEMIVQFWCKEGLGTNFFSMTFDRGEINALYTYLQIITGVLSEDSAQVQTLIQKKILLPE